MTDDANTARNGMDPSNAARTPITTPLRPALPLATRVNRNVLIVAAVIMAAIVITAIVTMNPGHTRGADQPDVTATGSTTPHPAAPGFLDRPPGHLGTDSLATSNLPVTEGASPMNAPNGTETPGAFDGRSTGRGDVPPIGGSDPRTLAPIEMPSTMPAAAPTPPSPRAIAYARALISRPSVVLDSTSPNHARAAIETDTVSGLTLAPAPPAAATPRVTSSKSGYTTFLANARTPMPSTIPSVLVPPASPYTVQAGTVIPGLLITGITSDLPGQILGQVARDVYDSPTQRIVLIPKGAKLLATYDNEIIAGQHRLLVAFTRIIFPDGRSIALPGLGMTDAQGAAGVTGDVDNHIRHVFGNALLLSVLSAGVQLSQPRTGTSVLTPPSAGQVAAGAVGEELSQVAADLLRKNLEIQPTITIPPGTLFNVFLNADLVFRGPYIDARTTRPTDPRTK